MAKKLKKDIYTLEEIGNIIYELDQKADAVRFRKPVSAYSAAKKAALKLGIEDINGKKRNKLIAARDAEAIISFVMNGDDKAVKEAVPEPKPLQVSIFDLFQDEEEGKTFDFSVGIETEEPIIEASSEDETKEALAEFIRAREKLEQLIGYKIIIYFKDYFI